MSKNHKNYVYRFITSTSIFDGHDVSIQIIRRFLHENGVEVVHLGHNRSAEEVVSAAIQEGADGIAISSYQGGHVEYLTYTLELLNKYNASNIKVFAGGGGVITPREVDILEKKGVAKIYTPQDGMEMGFIGMINDMKLKCDAARQPFSARINNLIPSLNQPLIDKSHHTLTGLLISMRENSENGLHLETFINKLKRHTKKYKVPILGFTGTGGAGKSSLIDEVILRFLKTYPKKTIAILSIDPTRKKTGGALLADRIRINSLTNNRVFFRSMATRMTGSSTSTYVKDTLEILRKMNFDSIIVETAGIGQSDTEIVNFADICTYVMTPEYGSPSQLEKIAMFDYADYVVLNKSDKVGAKDAFRDVQRAYRNIHKKFDTHSKNLPIFLAFP